MRRISNARALRIPFIIFWCLCGSISLNSVRHSPAAEFDYGVRDVRLERSVAYASLGYQNMELDLFRPHGTDGPFPLIVFVHGGAWMAGLRFDIPREVIALTNQGYAVATIDYRVSRFERFPANVHDVKAALRFLRANADLFDLDPNRFALIGLAAGGHLAMLAGIASGKLEGDLGDHDDTSSRPQAIVALHAPTNIQTMLTQNTPTGKGKHRPAVELMLGGPPEKNAVLAALASPVTHVQRDSPPLLVIHGEADDQIPVAQAYEMQTAYRTSGSPIEMMIIKGAGHRSLRCMDDDRMARIKTFLGHHLDPMNTVSGSTKSAQ